MGGHAIGAVIFGIFFLSAISVALIGLIRLDDKSGRSVDWHRRNGRWRVQYPNGGVSQPFTRSVAKDYAKLFGGVVVRKEKEPNESGQSELEEGSSSGRH
jgi:hypothetical protein